MSEFLSVDHPRFQRVQRAIFEKTVVADCMSHRCLLRTLGDREKLDACCQYGVDVDVAERDGILDHREEIAALLVPEAASAAWFTEEETVDADFPSGRHVRSVRHGDGCIFLAHDKRGCAIHRASVEGGWDFRGIKPNVCRLFPLSFESDAIVLSDDYSDYSCAGAPGAATVYRVGRADLGDIFGQELVAALDRVESAVVSDRAAAAG